METYFSTSQLSVGYDGESLIHDINMQLQKGQILALIGPNGSGKSTILKTITKYLKTIHGTVYIGGRSLDHMTERDLSFQLSVVLTQRMNTERMTCEEVVETGRYPYTGRFGILSDVDRAYVQEALELVNAADLRDYDFMKVSDGQRQRVLLARAICQQPEIIVLDEPTTFLDIRYKLELLEILRMLASDRGIGVILSMHELDIAQRIADYVMCVKGDTIAHYGTAEEIFKKDLIEDLYDLQNGSFNAVFGNLEMGRPEGEPHVFVIAGGGSGVALYRMLQKKKTPFITGILHENDVDFQVAQDLASEVIAQRGFDHISDQNFEQALACIRRCDTIINCLTEYGEINERNRDLMNRAKEMGCRVITDLNDIPDTLL